MTEQQKQTGITVINALRNALKAAKLPADRLGLLVTQVAHETEGFLADSKHNVIKYNNFSGIKYNAQKGAFKSPIMSPEKNYYASYLTPGDWAKDYLRILHKKNPEFGLSPLDAKGLLGFARSLKANGYFTATLENYANGLDNWKKWLQQHFKNIPFPTPVVSQGTLFEIAIIFLALLFLTDTKASL